MGLTIADLTQHPVIVRWLATQPADADLDILAAAHVAISDRYHDLRRRADEGRC
jgi:hypothetical protein